MNRTIFSLPAECTYRTGGGLTVTRRAEMFSGGTALDDLITRLDHHRGVVLSSGTTVPGRYESFDLGFSDPPLLLETTGTDFAITALNKRGQVLIAFIAETLHTDGASRVIVEVTDGSTPVGEAARATLVS